jgi:RND superfamily putative drug exporter
LASWTEFIVANRKKVLVAWVVLFLLGGFAAAGLGDLLTNRFVAPGTEAEDGREILSDRFGDEGDGNFTVVFRASEDRLRDPAFIGAAQEAVRRGAESIDDAKAGPVRPAEGGVAYAQITTPLEGADASNETPDVRDAVGEVPGAETYVTGFPAINEDTEEIFAEDLARGEMIAIPIALLVMAFMFGTLAGIAVPLLFAAVTLPSTLGFVWIFANFFDMATYVTNIVVLIGFAIAVDYSMLVVFRYREELARGHDPHDALMRTMRTAGRATLFSGLTVAVGLALLLFMPLPFMRSMGIGGLVVPLVSIAAAATFLPALLAVMGTRINRLRVVPRSVLERRTSEEGGMWSRLAHSIMRRPVPYLAVTSVFMIGLALFATRIDVFGGDFRGYPETTESTRGMAVLRDTVGIGALSPNQIVVDAKRTNGVWDPRSLQAQRRLASLLARDEQVAQGSVLATALEVPATGRPDPASLERLARGALVDREGRTAQIRAAPKTDAGTDESASLVRRIRDRYVPQAGFRSEEVYVTGSPAFNVDITEVTYDAFPWLIVAVLVLSYLILLRAFRSLFLPLKAVLLNVLSVSATYGLLVLVFQEGLGTGIGFQESGEVEFWIPVFLFAMLFGLSMDYEVFLLSRIREEWDRLHDNERAVAYGLEHTGRIITAAAIIMIAAFSGFLFGSFVGLQQFGLGLAGAVFLDATIVRAIMVPAAMKLLGNWNWYLPDRVRRALRLRPEPAPARGGS